MRKELLPAAMAVRDPNRSLGIGQNCPARGGKATTTHHHWVGTTHLKKGLLATRMMIVGPKEWLWTGAVLETRELQVNVVLECST